MGAGREWAGTIAIAGGLVGLALMAASQTETAQLARLEPGTRQRALALLTLLRNRGIRVKVTSTLRDEVKQAAAVASGASATSISWHLSGRALDVLVWDDRKGDWDGAGVRDDLWRIVHGEWAKLGGTGLAYKPYPTGPRYFITNTKGAKVWDGGHLEWKGPFATAAAAYTAFRKGTKVA